MEVYRAEDSMEDYNVITQDQQQQWRPRQQRWQQQQQQQQRYQYHHRHQPHQDLQHFQIQQGQLQLQQQELQRLQLQQLQRQQHQMNLLQEQQQSMQQLMFAQHNQFMQQLNHQQQFLPQMLRGVFDVRFDRIVQVTKRELGKVSKDLTTRSDRIASASVNHAIQTDVMPQLIALGTKADQSEQLSTSILTRLATLETSMAAITQHLGCGRTNQQQNNKHNKMRIQESSPEQEERIQSPQPEHGRRSPQNNRIRSPSPSLHETEGLPPADQETQVKLTYATQNDGTQCEEDESEENECETFTKMPFVGSRADENQGNPDNNGLAPFTLYRGENLHANNGASCSNEPGHAIADVAFARITVDERKPESINAIPLLFTKKKGESKTEKTSPASVGVVSKQQEQSNSDNGSVQEQGARSPSAGHEHRLPEQKRIRSPAARQREPEQSRSEKNNVIASVTIKKKQENKPRDSLVPFVGAEQEIREPGNSSSRAISAIKKEQNSKPEVRSLVSFTDTERENNEPENNSGANSVTNMRKQEDKTGGSNLAFSTGMDREKSESENNSGANSVTNKSKQKDKPGDSSLPFSTGKERARSETENNSAAIAVTKKSKQKDKPGDSSLPFSTGKERARSETENNSGAIAVTKKSKQEDKPGDSSLPLSTGKERARSETENKGGAISVNHEDNGRSGSTNDAQAKRGYLNAQESSRASLLKMIVLDDGTRQYTWDLYISGFTSLIHSGKEIASGVHQVESLQVQGCIVFLSKHSLQVWFTLRAASQRGDRHHSEGEWHGALQPGESTSGTKPSRVELHRAISNEDEVEPSTAAKDERTGARFKAAFVDLNGHLNEMVIGQPIEVKRSQIMERARERRLGSVRCNEVIESGYTSVGCGRDTAVLRYTVQLMD